MTDATAVRARLREVLGERAVVDDPSELEHYGQDRCRGGWPIAPSALVFPRSVEDVVAAVRACGELGVPVVPSGGRTGLAGAAAATAGEVVVSLERMNRVTNVDVGARLLTAEAGATVASVQAAASDHGLLYPVDWAASGSAHLAGSIATNAGGIRVIRYGLTRQWVQALDVVLASGEVLHLGANVVKDNTGYDLRQLFIGSEGTLGIIVGATMRLTTPPHGHVVALCAAADDASILALFERVRAAPVTISAFECFDGACVPHVLHHRGGEHGPFAQSHARMILVEAEVPTVDAEEETRDELTLALADAQDAGEIADGVVASSLAQARDLWAWREDISESLHTHTPYKADVSVPHGSLVEFVQQWRTAIAEDLAGIEGVCFGHVGDGNLHLNLLRPEGVSLEVFLDRCHAFDDRLYGLVRDCGGSVSAEHGIGLLKRRALPYTRDAGEIAAMRALKAAMDPRGLMNPGKIFDV